MNNLSKNLLSLRKHKGLSQEELAEKVGVSRQAISKWESGETTPDIIHCDILASIYEVSLDDLVHFNENTQGYPIPPKDKHLFGTAQVGERGQIVLPKKARDTFGLKHGDTLIVLGDSNPITPGIALITEEVFKCIIGE